MIPHPLFLEVIGSDINWTLICTMLMAIGTIGMWVDAKSTTKRQALKIEQPISTTKIYPNVTVADIEKRDQEIRRRLDNHDIEIAAIRTMIHAELQNMEHRLSDSGEQRVAKLHDRINDVLEAVSELRGKMES